MDQDKQDKGYPPLKRDRDRDASYAGGGWLEPTNKKRASIKNELKSESDQEDAKPPAIIKKDQDRDATYDGGRGLDPNKERTPGAVKKEFKLDEEDAVKDDEKPPAFTKNEDRGNYQPAPPRPPSRPVMEHVVPGWVPYEKFVIPESTNTEYRASIPTRYEEAIAFFDARLDSATMAAWRAAVQKCKEKAQKKGYSFDPQFPNGPLLYKAPITYPSSEDAEYDDEDGYESGPRPKMGGGGTQTAVEPPPNPDTYRLFCTSLKHFTHMWNPGPNTKQCPCPCNRDVTSKGSEWREKFGIPNGVIDDHLKCKAKFQGLEGLMQHLGSHGFQDDVCHTAALAFMETLKPVL